MASGPDTECTYKQIADSFKMPYGTIARVIKDFIDNGDSVVTRKRGRKAPPVPQEVQRALLPATCIRPELDDPIRVEELARPEFGRNFSSKSGAVRDELSLRSKSGRAKTP